LIFRGFPVAQFGLKFCLFLAACCDRKWFYFHAAWWVIFVRHAMGKDNFNLLPLNMICYICCCWLTCWLWPAHVIKTLYLRILSLEYVGYRFKLRYKR
jgi:hypothetical protein